MGMGSAAASALVVERDDLKELKLESFKTFEAHLIEANVDFDDVAIVRSGFREVDLNEDDQEELDVALELFEKFVKEFRIKYGLNIELDYHDQEDEGDRYDDLDGAFFCLDFHEVYTLTPQASVLNSIAPIERKAFTVWG